MERFNTDKWKYHDYDTSRYPFKELLAELLGRDDFENLHDSVDYPELLTMKNEQDTIYHRSFYKGVRESKFI